MSPVANIIREFLIIRHKRINALGGNRGNGFFHGHVCDVNTHTHSVTLERRQIMASSLDSANVILGIILMMHKVTGVAGKLQHSANLGVQDIFDQEVFLQVAIAITATCLFTKGRVCIIDDFSNIIFFHDTLLNRKRIRTTIILLK